MYRQVGEPLKVEGYHNANSLPELIDAAHERCESLVTRAHEAVRDKLRWYAEQKGLLYSLEAFNFKSSVSP